MVNDNLFALFRLGGYKAYFSNNNALREGGGGGGGEY